MNNSPFSTGFGKIWLCQDLGLILCPAGEMMCAARCDEDLTIHRLTGVMDFLAAICIRPALPCAGMMPR